MPLDHTRLDHPATDARQLRFRLDGPAALVQAVPYLVGFQPHRSLVLVGLDDDGALVVTVRLDIGGADLRNDLSHALEVLLGAGVADVIALVYDDRGPSHDRDRHVALEYLADFSAHSGVHIVDALVVADGRWWSLSCRDAECCPPGGRAVDEHTSAFAAAATYAGMVVHPDRGALAAILDPVDQTARDELAPLLAGAENAAVRSVRDGNAQRRERSVKRALFAAARRADTIDAPVRALPREDLVRFGVALREIAIRDAVWLAVDDARLRGGPLWAELARRLPSPYDAAPSFLCGWNAWRAGNGALAGIAARRAIESDPGYSAADLLLAAVSSGIDPRRMPKLRARR